MSWGGPRPKGNRRKKRKHPQHKDECSVSDQLSEREKDFERMLTEQRSRAQAVETMNSVNVHTEMPPPAIEEASVIPGYVFDPVQKKYFRASKDFSIVPGRIVSMTSQSNHWKFSFGSALRRPTASSNSSSSTASIVLGSASVQFLPHTTPSRSLLHELLHSQSATLFSSPTGQRCGLRSGPGATYAEARQFAHTGCRPLLLRDEDHTEALPENEVVSVWDLDYHASAGLADLDYHASAGLANEVVSVWDLDYHASAGLAVVVDGLRVYISQRFVSDRGGGVCHNTLSPRDLVFSSTEHIRRIRWNCCRSRPVLAIMLVQDIIFVQLRSEKETREAQLDVGGRGATSTNGGPHHGFVIGSSSTVTGSSSRVMGSSRANLPQLLRIFGLRIIHSIEWCPGRTGHRYCFLWAATDHGVVTLSFDCHTNTSSLCGHVHRNKLFSSETSPATTMCAYRGSPCVPEEALMRQMFVGLRNGSVALSDGRIPANVGVQLPKLAYCVDHIYNFRPDSRFHNPNHVVIQDCVASQCLLYDVRATATPFVRVLGTELDASTGISSSKQNCHAGNNKRNRMRFKLHAEPAQPQRKFKLHAEPAQPQRSLHRRGFYVHDDMDVLVTSVAHPTNLYQDVLAVLSLQHDHACLSRAADADANGSSDLGNEFILPEREFQDVRWTQIMRNPNCEHADADADNFGTVIVNHVAGEGHKFVRQFF